MPQLWLRACSLVVADDSGDQVELAGQNLSATLRIKFHVTYWRNSTPTSLNTRIYNLSNKTIQTIIGLASNNPPTNTGVPFASSALVTLKAGYISSPLIQIFQGQIYQMRMGYENSTDSYLDIFAADGDLAHTYSTTSTVLAKGYTAVQLWNAYAQACVKWGVNPGAPPDGLSTTPSPRGKATYGQTRKRLDDLAKTHNFSWAVVNGQLQALANFAARTNDPIIVNHTTGQIGFPEQTDQGVLVTSLLNPQIYWGAHVRLNESEISKLVVTNQSGTPGVGSTSSSAAQSYQVNAESGSIYSPSFIPPLNTDGDYVVIWSEHVGDTRENDWFTKFACISIDPSAPVPLASGVPLPTLVNSTTQFGGGVAP